MVRRLRAGVRSEAMFRIDEDRPDDARPTSMPVTIPEAGASATAAALRFAASTRTLYRALDDFDRLAAEAERELRSL